MSNNIIGMFRAIGFVIILYALSQMMSSTFQAFESASVAVFHTLETAAVVSEEQMQQMH